MKVSVNPSHTMIQYAFSKVIYRNHLNTTNFSSGQIKPVLVNNSFFFFYVAMLFMLLCFCFFLCCITCYGHTIANGIDVLTFDFKSVSWKGGMPAASDVIRPLNGR